MTASHPRPPVFTGSTVLIMALALAVIGGLACSKKASGPTREMVMPLLQQEAQSLKTDGEKPQPELGVKATWAVEGVDLREQPANESAPWAGTIRFKIMSEMREVDGSPVTQTFQKRFEYVWSPAMSRWLIQYTPPAP